MMITTKLKIKEGDTVEVIAGADKGKKGEVMDLDRRRLKIRVRGVRMQTHFDKEEGQFKKEGLIDYSNVKLVEAAAAKKTAKKKAKKATARK